MPEAVIHSKCAPVIHDVGDYPTLTKADYTGLTPKTIEDLAEIGLGEEAFLWRQMMLGGLSGVQENSLAELFLSRAAGPGRDPSMALTKQNLGPNKSYFLPYIMRAKEDVINANAFVVVSGEENTHAGTTHEGFTYHAGSWQVLVRNTSSAFGSDLKSIERMFLPGEGVIFNNIDDTGSVMRPVLIVERAVNANANGVEQALLFVRPPYTNAEWGALTSDQKQFYQPGTDSVIIPGTNSVSNYESYCHNQPAWLSSRVHAYFPQTSRFTRSWDDEYEEFLKYIFEGKVNYYLEKFRVLPSAEQNKRMYQIYQNKFINTVMWGQPFNQQQSVEGYKDMPRVHDPRTGTFIHYKGEATGIYGQLKACDRVIDNKGKRLNFNTLEELLYQLKRHRETRKAASVEDIDVFVDRHNAARIESMMMQYYKKKYGVTTQIKYVDSDPITIDVGNKKRRVLWTKRSYEMAEINIMLHVFVVHAFGDNRLHYSPQIRSAANMMWFWDISDFTLGIQGVETRKSKTHDMDADPDFQCIIKANYTYHTMEGTTFCPIVGEESQHLIIENFSDECPVYTAQVCDAQESSTSASVEA